MSKESQQWLDTYTLHGFGRIPWHGQEGNDNIFPGAIPVDEVLRRLFPFQAVGLPVFIEVPATLEDMTGLNEDGAPVRLIRADDRQAIVPNDRFANLTGADIFGVFKDGYVVHQFQEWLLEKVDALHLPIGSAGLLRRRGQAWVSFETEQESFASGVKFYPRLLTTTSHDGSTSSTYKLVFTLVVCDNTREEALGEKSPTVKIKHSKYSQLRASDLTDTLGLIQEAAEVFGHEIEALTNMKVTEAQWQAIVAKLAPDGGESKAAVTRGTDRRQTLDALWRFDQRVAPWTGTAFGVVQAFNTYDQHKRPVRGGTVRQDRNMLDTLSGKVGDTDRLVLATVGEVLGVTI